MRVYGPVPSRRFGLSLGIDLVPHKVCSYDCLYCQLGRTTRLEAEPQDFFPIDQVMADVRHALATGPRPDVLTLAGSGEPTLYGSLAELNERLRAELDIPLLLITNGGTLWHPDVDRAALRTDILAPSIDAGDERTWRRLNRPHPAVSWDQMLRGLREVTHAHSGEVRVEVMLVRKVNDDEPSLRAIAEVLRTLRADRIDVNTPVRPSLPERGAMPCDEQTLQLALSLFGPKAAPIGRFQRRDLEPRERPWTDTDKDVREMLLRRPCTAEDIRSSLGLHAHEVAKVLDRLVQEGLIDIRPGDGGTYYHASTLGLAEVE